MKFRLSHVSNSSSSSYFLNIKNSSFTDFANQLMCEYGGDFLNRKIIKDKINKTIAYLKKTIEKYSKNKKDILYKSWFEDNKKCLTKYEKHLRDIKETGLDADVVKILFDIEDIKIEDNKNSFGLSYFTSMHNSYNEGMSDIFKEIVSFCIFNKKYKSEVRRESDNDYNEEKFEEYNTAIEKKNAKKRKKS